MPLDFPNNPTNGQTYTDSNITWRYDGEKWNILISGGPTYETTLPSGAADGREIYYAADATNSIIWHLRYRSAARSGSGAWEYLGGPPAYSAVETGQSTVSTHSNFQDLTTAGPSFTAPLKGDYIVQFACQAFGPGAGDFGMAAVKIGSATTLDANSVFQTQQAMNNSITGGNTLKVSVTAESTVLKIQYRSYSNNVSYYQHRRMNVIPIFLY